MKLPVNKSILTAFVIAIAIALWLFSGTFKEEEVKENKSVTEVQTQEKQEIKVQVTSLRAQNHPKVIRIFGQTQADREVEVKAETEGHISEVLIEKGATVKKGDVIARVAMEDRNRRLRSAQALLRQRQLEFEADKKLSKKNFRSQTKLAETEALLNAARADLESIKVDIIHTEIKAPFDGKLEDRSIEAGSFVDKGTLVGKIVDLSPIVVTADISETDISRIQDGQQAQAILNDGYVIDAIVRYVASASDKSTRTYRVELEGENPQNRIAAGQTAQVRLTVGSKKAYRLSPAIMTLSDDGVIGVKVVNSQDIIEFYKVALVEDTANGVWVSGLPDEARIITRGQEYVKAGQKVIAIESGTERKDPSLAQAQGN